MKFLIAIKPAGEKYTSLLNAILIVEI